MFVMTLLIDFSYFRGREEFLSHMITPSTGCVNVTDRQESQNWTFIEEDIDEEVILIYN